MHNVEWISVRCRLYEVSNEVTTHEEEDVMKSKECLQLMFYIYFARIASILDHILSFLWCILLHNFIIPKGLSLLTSPPVSTRNWREPSSVCRRPVWPIRLFWIVWMALWVIIFYYWRIVFWPLWFSIWGIFLQCPSNFICERSYHGVISLYEWQLMRRCNSLCLFTLLPGGIS